MGRCKPSKTSSLSRNIWHCLLESVLHSREKSRTASSTGCWLKSRLNTSASVFASTWLLPSLTVPCVYFVLCHIHILCTWTFLPMPTFYPRLQGLGAFHLQWLNNGFWQTLRCRDFRKRHVSFMESKTKLSCDGDFWLTFVFKKNNLSAITDAVLSPILSELIAWTAVCSVCLV